MRLQVRRIARWIMVASFLYAAVGKLWNSGNGGGTILGESPRWVQASLPIGELALAAWLLSGFFPRSATIVSISVLSIFCGVIGIELGKPQPKPCGCGGATASQDPETIRRSLYLAMGRNIVLMGAGSYLFLSSRITDRTIRDTQNLPPANPVSNAIF